MTEEIKKELTEHIIPFWNKLVDYDNGGFHGSVTHDLIVEKGGVKNAVLHARILWFYSNCYTVLKTPAYLDMARHCYDFIIKNFLDRESGGAFWSVNVKGVPVNPMKHGYCNAFLVYALSAYYEASRDQSALNNAMRVFETIETRMADKIGYLEAFDRNWKPIENELLSPKTKEFIAVKTTGTVLHLIEAYTELYKVSKNEDVASRLKYLLALVETKIFDKSNRCLPEFFDKNMNPMNNVHVYGHSVEGAWLIRRAIDVLGDELPFERQYELEGMCRALIEKIEQTAFDDWGALRYESRGNFINKSRAWWPQAEAFIAFSDAYKRDGIPRYLSRSRILWKFIKEHIIDKREGGEWLNELNTDNIPKKLPIVSDWKCPYHNGRMCLMAITEQYVEFEDQ